MNDVLKGEVALVTGASGGIGAAIARHLAEAGARVVVHGHTGGERAQVVVDTLAGRGHRLALADLRSPEAARALVEGVDGLSLLVNNAGVFEPCPPLETDFDAWCATWTRTVETNLLGPAHCSWAAAHEMKGRGGSIINVGSRGAYRGEPSAPAYGASKAGLHQLTQSLAIALAPHDIAVYGVAPGFVETAMARPHLQGEAGERIKHQSPFGRVATVDDVAYWVGCLASPAARYASGAIIDVNGASHLR